MDWKILLEVATRVSEFLVPIVLIVIAFLTYARRGRVKIGSFSLDFDKSLEAELLLAKRRMIREEGGLDAAERQYVLLRSYHAQSLAQSKQSFWFSLVFASLGFGVIVLAILGTAPTYDKTIKLISGTVIDAVAGLFFVQSNKARELMSEFFDKLRADRKLESLH